MQIFFIFWKMNVSSQWVSDQPCSVVSVRLWNLFDGGYQDFLPKINILKGNYCILWKTAKIWLSKSISYDRNCLIFPIFLSNMKNSSVEPIWEVSIQEQVMKLWKYKEVWHNGMCNPWCLLSKPKI